MKKSKIAKRMNDAARKMNMMRMHQLLWEFLEFKIRDLEVHFGSVEDGLVETIFSKAIGFAKKHKTWKFWLCCFFDANWARMLVNGIWKAVDTRKALKIIEEQSNRQSADLVFHSNVKWPISDNVEREKILQSIYDKFTVLLRNNCLSKSNLEKVIKDSMDELHNLVPLP
ncbi:hypothetical protein CsSME_00003368 [Camellia sinensis var. sinensis]